MDSTQVSGIILPKSLAGMGDGWFGRCHQLTKIVVPEDNPVLSFEDGILYTKDGYRLILCARDQKGSLRLEEGVGVILDYAFACCHDLTEIVLSDSVSYILSYAFRECTSLKSIYIPETVHFLANYLFEGCTSLEEICYGGTREAWESLTARNDLGIDTEKTSITFMGKEYEQPYVNVL